MPGITQAKAQLFAPRAPDQPLMDEGSSPQRGGAPWHSRGGGEAAGGRRHSHNSARSGSRAGESTTFESFRRAQDTLDSLAPHWTAKGERKAWSIQWGPWAEVGMAVQANTLQRAKAMGVGALGTAHGMAVMGSVLASGDLVVGAAIVNWGKYLRSAYQETPRFLLDMEAEARKAAPAKADGGDGSSLTLAGLSAQERLEAVTDFLQNMAREVVDNQDLGPDDALLENGLDSLSGVEFRNRLVTEFETVRMPNSLVFDHPTVNALALFINEQLGDTPAAEAPSTSAPAVQAPAAGAPKPAIVQPPKATAWQQAPKTADSGKAAGKGDYGKSDYNKGGYGKGDYGKGDYSKGKGYEKGGGKRYSPY